MRLLYSFFQLAAFTTFLCQWPLLEGYREARMDLANSPHIKRHETSIKQALTNIPDIEPSSGMEGVDCLYVINLAKRPEKWQRVQDLCTAYGLLPSRVNGVDGAKLSKQTTSALFGKYPIRMQSGQIGCLLSHVSIFLDSLQRNFNCVWICEDDIDFLDDPLQMPNLLEQLTQIDPDWDILYTDPEFVIPSCYGPEWPAPGTPLRNLKYDFRPDQLHMSIRYYLSKQIINNSFTRIAQRYGTYSYFVSKKGISKLVNYFLHVYLWSAIDIDMHYVPHIRQYVLNRPVVSHWIGSTTQDTRD